MKLRTFLTLAVLVGCIFAAGLYTKAAQSSKSENMIIQAMVDAKTPQLIKEFISQMKEMLDVNDDNFPELIRDVEAFTAKTADVPSAAVLHSMIAEMYNQYYQLNKWKIDPRTPIAGYVPEDMREWTSNHFTDKVREALDASLKSAEVLQQTPVSGFKEILAEGKDSPELRPTVYDFLVYRAIEIRPTDELYRELIAFRNSQPDKKAALLVELDYLKYTSDKNYTTDNLTLYESSLDSLLRIYKDKDYSVEIINDKLELLQNKGHLNETADSIRTERYQLAKETIARFPNYSQIGNVKNILASMEEPRIQLEGSNTVYPGTNLELKLAYTNVSRINVKIYRSLRPIIETQAYYSSDDKNTKRGEMIKEVSFPLGLKNTYTSESTTLSVPMEGLGLYEYEVSVPDNDKLTVSNLFCVSRLAVISRSLAHGQSEVIVTDYRTGKPIENALVNYYKGGRRDLELAGSVKSDRDGIAVLPRETEMAAYQASLPGDTSLFVTNIYIGSNRYEEQEVRTRVSLLTDRGLYRPGQTVYFKGIAYTNDKDNPAVVANKTYEVILRDANYKEVSTLTLKTSKFGSFTGEFVLPRQVLNGMFTLSTENGSVHIRVEEYKRPTFMVNLLPVKEDITFGDEVSINGNAKTFSGVSLQSGDVAYRVVRRPFWFRIWDNYTEEQVAGGVTTVGKDGTFSFSFYPTKKNTSIQPFYHTYEVIATLTNSNGETQEARSSFSVGDRSIIFQTNLSEQTNKDSVELRIQAKTLNGGNASVKGTYTVVKLDDTKDENIYKEGKPVGSGSFSSNEPLPKNAISQLPSGRLRIKMKGNDTKGRPVEQEQDFILYSKKDKSPPVFKHTWLLTEKTNCLPGEEAEIVFGTSDKEAYVLYELFVGGKNISRKRMVLSNENKIFRIPFLDSYADGVMVSFTFMKEGKFYNSQIPVTRKQPDRTLAIRQETFRDKLLPGSRENWTFRITDKDSLAVSAEVLAGMYDASLDKIVPFSWYFSPDTYIPIYRNYYSSSEGLMFRSGYASVSPVYLPVPQYAFSRLDWQGIMNVGSRSSYRRSYAGGVVMKSMAPNQLASGVQESAVMSESMVVADVVQQRVSAPQTSEMPEEGASTSSIRTNFNETAFFFPTLQTDKDGNVSINFTIPESNTTWKLQTLAHTPDLKHGLSTNEIITQKPLMVLPNLPRFIRSGDQVSISTQVINLTGAAVGGTARLELFNPADDKPLAGLSGTQKPFTLQTDESATVSWTVTVPGGVDLVGCRIVAETEAASDGEQHLIPILPSEMLVTESTPFYLTGKGEKVVNIPVDKASDTRRPYRMTLEFSGNPVWYAVQALPTVAQPDNDNVISWFASYYMNTLAASIARSNPKIKAVIDQWAAQGGTASTLYSNLEKNEELKAILLEETPWVLEAKSETDQKQRLALLFDVNRATQQREAAMKVLLEQQMEGGGWGWFKGFYPSRSITLFILDGMSQLVRLNALEFTNEEREMQIKALQFMDKAIQKDYDWLLNSKAKLKDYVPTVGQLDYLYVRSSYRDIPEWEGAREGIRYFTGQAEKQWKKASLLGKGETALLMHRNGKKAVAKDILAWLRKTATTSGDKGMYWANNRRENNYFVSPVDVHCLLLAAFDEIEAKSGETDKLKQWLLNQKRTQNWESVPSTVNAIYSLLSIGSDWLSDDNKSVVRWGNKTFDPSSGETATGYIKEVATASEIVPSMDKLTVNKQGEAPAWGAVYNQYFEKIEKIGNQKGILDVEKKLFVETNNDAQRQITPVAEGNTLHVGDKVVVRLTIRSDRDMEYVSLKDLRAGCFEPTIQVSATKYAGGLRYYYSPKDVSENFYFDTLPAGTHVLEYSAYVTRSGSYSGGIATIQCMYAPEFVSHTEGIKLTVNQ